MFKDRIEIAIGNKKIVAEINDCGDKIPKELCIFIVDEDNRVVQDICLIREFYTHGKHCTIERLSDVVQCFVWADSNDEDYSNVFLIGMYENEEGTED